MSGLYGFTTLLWPIRFKPLSDELLSSWIVRLAHGHGLKVQTFCNRLFGNTRQVWNRDIDRLAPAWLLETLSLHTGTPLKRVAETTLRRYEGLFYHRFRSSGHLHWIQIMQMYHRKRAGFGQQYCPHCLATDMVPYFRTRWRLSLLTVCTQHQCMLLDRCRVCDAPVSFHRIDTGHVLDESRDLATCFSCGSDLSVGADATVQVYDADAFCWLVGLVSEVEQFAIGDGQCLDVGKISVLHHLIYLMLSASKAIRLNEYVADCLGVEERVWLTQKRIVIEALPASDRHQLLQQAAWLMVDLESRIKDAWRDRAVRYNHLLKDFLDPPGWYKRCVKRLPHSTRGGPRPNHYSL